MKLYAIVTAIFLICLSTLGILYAWNNFKVKEESRAIPPFNSIYSGGLMNVYLQKGKKGSVIIKADENIIGNVITEVVEGQLRIYTKGFIQGERITDAYVTYTHLDSLNADNASTLTSQNLIQAPSFQIIANGAAEIKVQLQADTAKLIMNKNANVQLAGGADYFEFLISQVGDLMAYNFQTNHCLAKVITGPQSPGVARINVQETLNAVLHGPRYIYYKGDPEITQEIIQGSGKLIQK